MEATYIVFALAIWCAVSIPAGLLIGGAIALGGDKAADSTDVRQAA
jgi:hypothetical protein